MFLGWRSLITRVVSFWSWMAGLSPKSIDAWMAINPLRLFFFRLPFLLMLLFSAPVFFQFIRMYSKSTLLFLVGLISISL